MHAAVNEKSTTTKTGSDTYLMLKNFLAPRVVIKRRDDGTADPRTFFFTEEAAEDAILQSPFADDERVSLTQRDDDFWYFYLSDERDVPLKLEFDTSRAKLPREDEYDFRYNAISNIARFIINLIETVGEDAVDVYERVHGRRLVVEFKGLYCFVCEEGVELPWNEFVAFKENGPETVAFWLLAMECSTRSTTRRKLNKEAVDCRKISYFTAIGILHSDEQGSGSQFATREDAIAAKNKYVQQVWLRLEAHCLFGSFANAFHQHTHVTVTEGPEGSIGSCFWRHSEKLITFDEDDKKQFAKLLTSHTHNLKREHNQDIPDSQFSDWHGFMCCFMEENVFGYFESLFNSFTRLEQRVDGQWMCSWSGTDRDSPPLLFDHQVEFKHFDSARNSAHDFYICGAYTTHRVLLIFQAEAKRLMTRLSDGELELPYHRITESTTRSLKDLAISPREGPKTNPSTEELEKQCAVK